METPIFKALLMSCPPRSVVRAATVASFARTDWQGGLEEVIDDETSGDRLRGITRTWRRLMQRALECDADFYLMMEDDLELNVHIEHNLRRWAPLRGKAGNQPFFGSLYNPQRPFIIRRDALNYFVADPNDFWGTQAIVVSRATVGYLLRFWDDGAVADIMMSRLAARVSAIYHHAPSLAQHTGNVSTWGGIQHTAADYDPLFRTTAPLPVGPSNGFVTW